MVCSCYRPQHRDIIDFCYDIDTILDNASDSCQSFLFLGDMNARNKDFRSEDLTNTEGRALKAFFDSHNFTQLIHEPTRTQKGAKSCLDLIFTNTPSLISCVGTRPKVYQTCDHMPIYAIFTTVFPKPNSYKRWVWNYNRGDMLRFRSLLLDGLWLTCYNSQNPDEIVNAWVKMFVETAETCIPHYAATIRPRDKEFMNTYIRQLISKRDKLHKKVKRNPNNEAIKVRYKEARNKVVTEIAKAKFELEKERNSKISSVESSNKDWWKLTKSALVMTSSPSISNTPLLDGTDIITNDIEKANLINSFFVQQSMLNDSNAQLPPNPPQPEIKIEQKVIQPEEVFEILINLDISKATGPDGISNRLLRESAVSIAQPLSHLFNYSLSTGYFPEQWKIANVIPVFKKDDPMLCNNYRPISLLCCISKVFEKILFNHIYSFLKRNKLLNRNQSGFTPGDGTINQLINICNKIHCQLDNGDEVLAVFLDLSKAFDKVWHQGLIYKLEKIGIDGNLLVWLKSYLSNRKQQVVINGKQSDILELNAGVPQGSVLGPLLFLIYINDMTEGLTGEVFLFADDSSVFHSVNKNINRCAEKMNHDLSLIYAWAEQWLVTINAIKTVFMLFSTRRPNLLVPPIMLGRSTLKQVFSHKHLGLILKPNLSWGEHISSIIAKANKRLFILKHYKYKLSRYALATGYMNFIRPIIEYGDVLYDSCTLEQSNLIEKLQHEAARTVTGAKFRSSPDMLYKELGWVPLKNRRKMHKLSKIYAMKNKLSPGYLCDLLESFQDRHEYNTRRVVSANYLQYPFPKKELFNRSFIVSSIKEWNKLDPNIANAPSLESFKNKLKAKYKVHHPIMNKHLDRHSEIVIAQLRIGFSDLNDHLFLKGCLEDPQCLCGYRCENTSHFLLECPLYSNIRNNMIQKINQLNSSLTVNANLLLYGDETLNFTSNNLIQTYLSEMLRSSQRFLNRQNDSS